MEFSAWGQFLCPGSFLHCRQGQDIGASPHIHQPLVVTFAVAPRSHRKEGPNFTLHGTKGGFRVRVGGCRTQLPSLLAPRLWREVGAKAKPLYLFSSSSGRKTCAQWPSPPQQR